MYKFIYLILLLVFVKSIEVFGAECDKYSVTSVSGRLAPKKKICQGELIFEEKFNNFDFKKWQHENTLSGGGNWEFQWYTNNRSNSYVKDGKLYIKPTLTADTIGEENLSKMTLDINGGSPADYCTDFRFWGCLRTGTPTNILNPITSAKLTTINSFAFKFGKLQVKAKIPTGDWLWPAIWLMPRFNEYGTWPLSGEIDLMESRGNENLIQNDVNIGVEQVASTLHWGPAPNQNQYQRTHVANQSQTFNKDFKVYELIWTPEYLNFSIDGKPTGSVYPKESFWNFGELNSSRMDNPWKYGTNMAPFDQEFYIIMNLAVGGTNGFFPDDANNTHPKPWKNTSPQAMLDFWKAKSSWLPTWKLDENNGEDAALQVDSVKVWAL